YWIIGELGKNIKKTNIKNDVCLHSEKIASQIAIFLYLFHFFLIKLRINKYGLLRLSIMTKIGQFMI
ncbi:hypothetical protein, partial [Streptococcus salivarius]